MLMIGHSFVRHLKDFIDKGITENHEFDIKTDRISTRYIGIPGGRASDIYSIINSQIRRQKSLLAILLIGGNDISDTRTNPGRTADTIMDTARALIRKGFKYVVVSQIIPRNTGEHFINRMIECNLRLIALCSIEDQIIFWAHQRVNRNPNIHSRDRTHLNETGNRLLYRSLKNALSHTLAHHRENEPCRCRSTYQPEPGRRRGGRRFR